MSIITERSELLAYKNKATNFFRKLDGLVSQTQEFTKFHSVNFKN
jgi:hypothetical protein